MAWKFFNASGQLLTAPASTASADLATEATNVTVTANNSTAETVYPVFVDGATGTQGVESDTGLTYNPNTGLLTSAGFSGPLTGDASGTALTVTQAAQTAITSLGNLTALVVDDVAINGKVITMTGDTSDTIVLTAGAAGTLSLVTTDAAGSDADLSLDADGQVTIDANDAAGIFLGINGTNQINLVDGVLKPVTDDDVDLGVSGGPEFKNGYFNGTLEADVITIGGDNVLSGSIVTTLGTVSAGTWNGGVIAAAYLPDAGAAAQGVAELAVTSEINTGTDSTRIMPIDQYVASNRNIRYVFYRIVAAGTDVATATTVGGDFEFPFAGTITEVGTFNDTAGITGTQVVDIHKGGTTIMSSDKCDTDTTEKTTRSAANPPALTTTAIAEGDILTFDIDAIHSGTAAKGLTVRIEVRVT